VKQNIKTNILINFFTQVKLFFSSFSILTDLKNIKPKFIFFSENKSYQKYAKPIIETLCSKYSNQIYYFSIHKDDIIDNQRVKNFFIYPFLLKFFFNNVRAENMFLTLTDLGNHFIKKTKNIERYIYYFHSPISTIKSYTPKAFDNYDFIMCNGQFQIEEIKSREKLKNLTRKKLIPTGYFYFDYLIENIKTDIKCEEILLAPSWNKNAKNLINENFIDLIDKLLKKDYKVIFRPHPEHFKRSINILNIIKKKFKSQNFNFDSDFDNIKSMEKAKCLITDNSGIAIEYMLVFKKPVLYLDELDKIHNSEFTEYVGFKTIDQTIKENFGYLFNKSHFDQIDKIIVNSEINFQKKLKELHKLIDENYFNFGNTKKYLLSNLDNFF
jgi:YidC/Oxa1 family membrane protein insertase